MHLGITSALCGIALAGALLVAGPTPALAQGHQADNTAVNKNDRNSQTPTADQGKNNSSDRELAAHIRREIVKDKSLSTYGHNVKVIAEHGQITLRGPVHSEDEKRAIEEHARRYAGEGKVNDELSVTQERK